MAKGLGTFTFPMMPQGIILTDRANGTLWLLSHNTVEDSPDDLGHVAITDVIPTSVQATTYLPGEEPVMGEQYTIRLIVRAGRLGYEVVSYPQGITDTDRAPILTRNLTTKRTISEITVPDSWVRYDDMLAWQSVVI